MTRDKLANAESGLAAQDVITRTAKELEAAAKATASKVADAEAECTRLKGEVAALTRARDMAVAHAVEADKERETTREQLAACLSQHSHSYDGARMDWLQSVSHPAVLSAYTPVLAPRTSRI